MELLEQLLAATDQVEEASRWRSKRARLQEQEVADNS
jgi:hypothetical protein